VANTADTLSLVQAQLGPMANYVYIIGDPTTRKAAVVDPAWEIDRIIEYVQSKDYTIEQILVTHYHQDHIGGNLFGQSIQGAAEMVGKISAKLNVNKHEAEGVKKVTGLSDSDLLKVEAGDVIKVGNLEVKYIHTPGHTPGSQCFLVEGNLISGDTLFVNSCGRVDLPGSNVEDMYHSLNHTLKNLPDETVVYPGHAYSSESSTTIANQKRHNMYMRFDNLDDFLMAMGVPR